MHVVMKVDNPLRARSQYSLAVTLGVTYPTVWRAFRREPVSAKMIACVLITYPRLIFDDVFEVVRVAPEPISSRGRASKVPEGLLTPAPDILPPAREEGPYPTNLDEALTLSTADVDPLAALQAINYMPEGTDATPVPHVELNNGEIWLCRFFEDGSIQLNTDAPPSALTPVLRAHGYTDVPGGGLIQQETTS